MTLLLAVDLGQSSNFVTKQSSTNAVNSRIVGIINDCEKYQNSSIYLNRPPTNNLFSVKILNENSQIATVNDYVLTLYFEKI